VGSPAGIAEATPPLQQRDVQAPSDHQLVAAVRRGDDRAFERLYSRYHRRIHAYVLGMCKDHARAEDITQEIFVSALRRMRETERPIAFKPWIYEIAKNACIDQHRRARRAEEVSLQAEDALAPADYGRLVTSGPSPDAALVVKQELDHLCGAFGGLSDTHHDILVMREFEGLSYREIGERLGMSRPAVESTLFRARRRLTEEFDELVSGQRCLRIQSIIATAGRGRLGARDTRRLARHVAHCQACRREALAAGLDPAVLRSPLRTRVTEKVAALLPFPLVGRRFGRGADDAAGGITGGWAAHLPAMSDQFGAGWTKAAAGVAVLLAGVGAGVGTKAVSSHPHGPAVPPAAVSSHGGSGSAHRSSAAAMGAPSRAAAHQLAVRASRVQRAARTSSDRAATSSTTAPAASGSPSGSTSGAPAAPTNVVKPVTGGTTPAVSTGGSGGGSTPSVALPPSGSDTTNAPSQVVQGTTGAVGGVPDQAPSVTSGAGSTIGSTADGATQQVSGAVQDTTDTVTGATGGLTP
jgi:RNA polymerase sigma factor (sigma-70 family)